MSLQVVFFRRSSWTQTLLWLIYCVSVIVLALGITAHAADFTGPVVSVLDGDTLEVLHNQYPERIRLSRIDCPEKGQAYGMRAKQAASPSPSGRKSRFRPTASTSTGVPLPMCFSQMERTSITNWSKTVGAGGTGSMRQGIRCWKGESTKRKRLRKGCGLIRSRCRRGSGGSGESSLSRQPVPYS